VVLNAKPGTTRSPPHGYRPVLGKHGIADAPEGDDSEARLSACLIAAKEEGIAKEDIEEEVGDLIDYMSVAVEPSMPTLIDRAVMKDGS
jgi:hypothetical protein